MKSGSLTYDFFDLHEFPLTWKKQLTTEFTENTE